MYFRLIRVRDFAGTLYGGNPLPTHNEEAIRGTSPRINDSAMLDNDRMAHL